MAIFDTACISWKDSQQVFDWKEDIGEGSVSALPSVRPRDAGTNAIQEVCDDGMTAANRQVASFLLADDAPNPLPLVDPRSDDFASLQHSPKRLHRLWGLV